MPDTFAEQADTVTEHQQAADLLAAKVIERAIAGGVAISEEIRRETMLAARRAARASEFPGMRLRLFLRDFLAILRRYEPVLIRTITDAQLAGWLEGGRGVVDRLLESHPFRESPPIGQFDRPDFADAPPDEPPAWISDAIHDEPNPIVRYPIIEAAATDLANRQILTAQAYYESRAAARMQGFAVSHVASLDALERVQEALFEAVADGDTLKDFGDKVGDVFETSGLSPHRIETVFRNNVNHSYARGQKAVVEHPLVRSVAAFVWRSEINDSRLTPLCYALSHSGLQGTAIYCTDDPVWKKVAAPSHHGCRCGAIFLDVKRAAAKGILVAQKWLETGVRPDESELFVAPPDLSEVPARDRLQFDSWVSPWAA